MGCSTRLVTTYRAPERGNELANAAMTSTGGSHTKKPMMKAHTMLAPG